MRESLILQTNERAESNRHVNILSALVVTLACTDAIQSQIRSLAKLLACLLLLLLTQIVISKLLGELLSDFGIAEVRELFIDPGNALINPVTIAVIPGRKDQRNEGESPQEKEPVPEHLHFRVRQQVQALHAREQLYECMEPLAEHSIVLACLCPLF